MQPFVSGCHDHFLSSECLAEKWLQRKFADMRIKIEWNPIFTELTHVC